MAGKNHGSRLLPPIFAILIITLIIQLLVSRAVIYVLPLKEEFQLSVVKIKPNQVYYSVNLSCSNPVYYKTKVITRALSTLSDIRAILGRMPKITRGNRILAQGFYEEQPVTCKKSENIAKKNVY